MRPHPSLVPAVALACAVFTSTQAFEFTGPNPNDKLNVTEVIRVSWDADGGSLDEPRAVSLDLWFNGHAGKDGKDRASWEIKANLSLAEYDLYDWVPDRDMKNIVDNDGTLSPAKVHTFSARLRDSDGNKLATLESEQYAIEGFDSYTDSSAALAQPRAFAAAGAVVAGMILGLGGL